MRPPDIFYFDSAIYFLPQRFSTANINHIVYFMLVNKVVHVYDSMIAPETLGAGGYGLGKSEKTGISFHSPGNVFSP